MKAPTARVTIQPGDTVKCRDRHRYVVTEVDGLDSYSASNLNWFGAQRLRPKGYTIQVNGRPFKVDEQHRSLSVTDVVTASRNGKVVYRSEGGGR